MVGELFLSLFVDAENKAGPLPNASDLYKIFRGIVVTDEELSELQRKSRQLREEITGGIKANFALDKELFLMDSHIRLLVRNFIRHQASGKGQESYIPSDAAPFSQEGQVNLLPLDAVSLEEQKIFAEKKFSDLLSLFLSSPSAMSVLARRARAAEVDAFLSLVLLTLFGDQFGADEEHNLHELFDNLISDEFETIKDNEKGSFLRANTATTKMLTSYGKRRAGASYLGSALRPPLLKLIDAAVADGQNCTEINPAKIKDEIRAQSVEDPAVQALLEKRLNFLIELVEGLVASLIETSSTVPYGIRFICRSILRHSVKRFPDASDEERATLVGGFIYLRLMNPCVVDPHVAGLLTDPVPANARRSLVMVAKIMQNLSNHVEFGEKEPWMAPLNQSLATARNDFTTFLLSLTELQEDNERLLLRALSLPIPSPQTYSADSEVETTQANNSSENSKQRKKHVTFDEMTALCSLVTRITDELRQCENCGTIETTTAGLETVFGKDNLVQPTETLTVILTEQSEMERKAAQKKKRVEAVKADMRAKGQDLDAEALLALELAEEDLKLDDPLALAIFSLWNLLPASSQVMFPETDFDIASCQALKEALEAAEATAAADTCAQVLLNLSQLPKSARTSWLWTLQALVAQRGLWATRGPSVHSRLVTVRAEVVSGTVARQAKREQYQEYISNIVQQAFQPSLSSAPNNAAVGPFAFRVQDLLSDGVLARTINITPTLLTQMIVIIGSPAPGRFDMRCAARGRDMMRSRWELTDLLEKEDSHGEAALVAVENLVFHIPSLIACLNASFIPQAPQGGHSSRGRGRPSR